MIWQRLRSATSHAAHSLGQNLRHFFQQKKGTQYNWDELEEMLIRTDMGMQTVHFLIESLRIFDGSTEQALEHICHQITNRLLPYEQNLDFPKIMLMVGVNGSGKTTTIGKIYHRWKQHGHSLRVVAGDVFRAAAIQQLSQWIPEKALITGAQEPASLAYQGCQMALQHNEDCIVDTAGRLPNNGGLMDELAKIYRVMQNSRPDETVHVIIVLDATVGQHALTQIKSFGQCVPLSGIIMTKMDGTAKGGILINCAHTYRLPVYALGYGEKASDLQDFSANLYAQKLLGLDQVS